MVGWETVGCDSPPIRRDSDTPTTRREKDRRDDGQLGKIEPPAPPPTSRSRAGPPPPCGAPCSQTIAVYHDDGTSEPTAYRRADGSAAPALESGGFLLADKNRLYYGDNLDVLRQYAENESTDLVYLNRFGF